MEKCVNVIFHCSQVCVLWLAVMKPNAVPKAVMESGFCAACGFYMIKERYRKKKTPVTICLFREIPHALAAVSQTDASPSPLLDTSCCAL